ncbi:UDP-3-O-(3-hydroxymyristoyl)glucosamine N-acyltransferase [Candidatus Desantisbacteria bacterium]|nr:UDP-3-O-(3-hydroxymyristoyl)glucosamine N-acyltransferase [Candidatus Desantisbacteria bacterium]
MITTLSEIARLVEGELLGNADIEISGVSGLDEATIPSLTPKKGQIAVVVNPKHLSQTIYASAVIVPEGVKEDALPALPMDKGRIPAIRVKNPKIALALLLNLFYPQEKPTPNIHPSSIIAKDAQLGRDVTIYPHVVVDKGAIIGDKVVLYPSVYVGKAVQIGDETIIHSQVTLYENTIIGRKVNIHAGCVIGADGFGYIKVDEIHHKIPQAGNVIVEDWVEIGANTTIDRATLGSTIIGNGTKIDNLVQIGHNVKIGKNCILVAQAAIGGSAIIEDGVIIAGKGAVSDHVTIGHHSIIGAKSGVMKDIPPKSVVSGFPARPYRDELKRKAYMEKLPELFKATERHRGTEVT